MKKIQFFISLLWLCIFISCNKGNNESTIYCGERILGEGQPNSTVLKEVYQMGLVTSYSNITIDSAKKLLGGFKNISGQYGSEGTYSAFVVQIPSKSCAESTVLLERIKEQAAVSNASKFYITGGGSYLALLDRVIGNLKSESDFEKLKTIAEKYSLKVLEHNGVKVVLSVDKNSPKDPIDMANELFKTGYFEWVEPDVLAEIKF